MAYRNDLLPGQALACTPSDLADNQFYGLYVGGAGDVAVVDEKGNASVIFKAVPAGGYVNLRGSKVLASGTTATNILLLR